MMGTNADDGDNSDQRQRSIWWEIIRPVSILLGGALILAGTIWRASTVEWQLLKLPLALLAATILVVGVLWKFPQRQVTLSPGVTPENRFDRENEARKTLAQILGGILLLTGIYFSTETLSTAREGQITDRFIKAIEQLGALREGGSVKLEVRLGAVYALERIARDSEEDYWPVIEILTAYVRENAPRQQNDEGPKPHPRADIQAILTVIGRRERTHDKDFLNLEKTSLCATSLRDFGNVELFDADLRWASMSGNFRKTSFGGADLRWASLIGTDLRGADFFKTNLSQAVLYHADLRDGNMFQANLHGTDLKRADLRKASFLGADLTGADFRGADLRDANNLAQTQIDAARGNRDTQLPNGLRTPESWTTELSLP